MAMDLLDTPLPNLFEQLLGEGPPSSPSLQAKKVFPSAH
jgi:hypothetical protein